MHRHRYLGKTAAQDCRSHATEAVGLEGRPRCTAAKLAWAPSGQHGGEHWQGLRALSVCCHPGQGKHFVKERHQVRPLQGVLRPISMELVQTVMCYKCNRHVGACCNCCYLRCQATLASTAVLMHGGSMKPAASPYRPNLCVFFLLLPTAKLVLLMLTCRVGPPPSVFHWLL